MAKKVTTPTEKDISKLAPKKASTRGKAASPLANQLKASIEHEIKRNSPAGPPHLIVQALAGVGKTTTIVEGLKYMKGLPTSIIPSPQQQAVWDEMLLSRDAKSIAFVAFNKSIATVLQERVPKGCDASTTHSMGFKAVNKAFKLRQPGAVNQYRVSDIIGEIYHRDTRDLMREKPTLISSTQELVRMCKANLSDTDYEALDSLASYYDIDLNHSRNEVFDLVPKVIERCKDIQRDGCVDFDDMVWAPVILQLPVFRYDLLLQDEVQDANRTQQALAKMAGNRLILVGDSHQSIYGFCGADAESMQRMEAELKATERGCVVLPLTVTRRCGKAIVEEARKIVPEFEAHESNSEGKVSHARYETPETTGGQGPCPNCEGVGKFAHEQLVGGDADVGALDIVEVDCEECGGTGYTTLAKQTTYHDQVKDGDLILCRVNSPIVGQAFKFLKAGRKATIAGRDIGQGLISTIKKMKATNIDDLVTKVTDWVNKEVAKENSKRNPNEHRLIALQDRADCIICFTEDAKVVNDVVKKIEAVFTDNKNSPGIKLSSVHKAKGTEADVVFLLQPKGATIPHPMAKTDWQRAGEQNILYVARTRAIHELVYVS